MHTEYYFEMKVGAAILKPVAIIILRREDNFKRRLWNVLLLSKHCNNDDSNDMSCVVRNVIFQIQLIVSLVDRCVQR